MKTGERGKAGGGEGRERRGEIEMGEKDGANREKEGIERREREIGLTGWRE